MGYVAVRCPSLPPFLVGCPPSPRPGPDLFLLDSQSGCKALFGFAGLSECACRSACCCCRPRVGLECPVLPNPSREPRAPFSLSQVWTFFALSRALILSVFAGGC